MHVGADEARNIGVRKAHELGCPFISLEELNGAIREIWVGHQDQVVEGENAWIQIATKKIIQHNTTLTNLYLKILDYTSLS